MHVKHILTGFKLSLISINLALTSTALLAAQKIDLSYQKTAILKSYIQLNKTNNELTTQVKEINRSISHRFKHLRMQEFVGNYAVWGADFVVHIPIQNPLGKTDNFYSNQVIMNGIMYQSLEEDLKNNSKNIFTEEQKQKAINFIINNEHIKPTEVETKLIVYVNNNKATWSYLVKFKIAKDKKIIKRPSYIIDANNFSIYQKWNEVRTLENVQAGGEGGNDRIGRRDYDGLNETGHFPVLNIQRDPILKTCYMRNENVLLRDLRFSLDDIQFSCAVKSVKHNNLYWNGENDNSNNGGYSPSNDTFYNAQLTLKMYRDWYDTIAWADIKGAPKRLQFWMHNEEANASFDPDGYITIGDSTTDPYYPFTTLDVLAHEISHGFTTQHSNLKYYGQSGAIDESFSDMAGKTTEFYANGKIDNWNIGALSIDESKWLRYMDQPSKDCQDREEGEQCSIDNMSQYNDSLNVHYSSGIFNRAFYLLATSEGWDVKKAFQLMLTSNKYYWTNVSSFCQAARGTLLATKELGYEEKAVIKAFNQVGIDPTSCAE